MKDKFRSYLLSFDKLNVSSYKICPFWVCLLRSVLELHSFFMSHVLPSLTLSQAAAFISCFSFASSVPGMGLVAAVILLWTCQLHKQRKG